MDTTSVQFTCKCEKQVTWLEDGKESKPCPECGRRYKGKYNRKICTIVGIEIKNKRCSK